VLPDDPHLREAGGSAAFRGSFRTSPFRAPHSRGPEAPPEANGAPAESIDMRTAREACGPLRARSDLLPASPERLALSWRGPGVMGARSGRLPELAGLPDWPLMMTEAAAAAYLGQKPCEFARGVGHGSLPPPRSTPGGDRWSRRDLDAWFSDGPAAQADAGEALGVAIDGWSRS